MCLDIHVHVYIYIHNVYMYVQDITELQQLLCVLWPQFIPSYAHYGGIIGAKEALCICTIYAVCIHVCVYICVYVCVCMYVQCTCVCRDICVCVCVCVCDFCLWALQCYQVIYPMCTNTAGSQKVCLSCIGYNHMHFSWTTLYQCACCMLRGRLLNYMYFSKALQKHSTVIFDNNDYITKYTSCQYTLLADYW